MNFNKNFHKIKKTTDRIVILSVVLTFFVSGCSSVHKPASTNQQNEQQILVEKIPEGNSYYSFLLSEIYQINQNKDLSLKHLIKAQKKDPESIFLKKVLARRYLLEKELEKSENLINQVLKTFPNDTEALGLYGGLLSLKKAPESEIAKIYEKILTIDPNNIKAPMALAYLLEKTNQRGRLIQIFEKALKKTDNNYFIYFYLGEAYLINKNYTQAKNRLSQAVKSEPTYIKPKLSLITAIQHLEKNKENKREIINLFNEIIALQPDQAAPFVELSYFYNTNGDYEKSDDIFKPVAQEWNIEKRQIIMLLHSYIDQALFEKADFLCSKIYQSTGDDTIILLCADKYRKNGFIKKAVNTYSSVEESSQLFAKANTYKAFIFAEKRDFAKAAQILEKALKIKPDDSLLLITLGNIYEEEQSFEKAKQIYKKGTSIQSDIKWNFLYRLGIVNDKQGNKQQALNYIKKALELNPEHPDILNYLGYTYAEMGINLDAAKKLLEKAVSLDPKNGYIIDSLGWVHHKQGDNRNALKIVHKAYELVQNDPVILEHLGDIYKALGQNKESKEYYIKALQIDPNNTELKKKASDFPNDL